MTWVRLDDKFADHPKIAGLSNDAFRLHITAMCWASSQLTDGFIPAQMMRRLAWFCDDQRATEIELVNAGIWHLAEDGYQIHDYLDYNPSREKIESEREAARERTANKRNRSREVRANFAGSSESVQLPRIPNPESPSPSERDEGLARPPASSPPAQEPADPEYGAALSKLESLGMLTGTSLMEFQALWPDLHNGRRAWLDDAIAIAHANKARSPTYAIRVLSNAVRSDKRPGEIPERTRPKGHDLDAILGITS